ncbi:MAG: TolC family protein [Bryobacteraceae bacterium]|nr:TolC family protein [Bryobacteraceae bacterium]
MKNLQSSTALLLATLLALPGSIFAQSASTSRMTGLPEQTSWHSRFTRAYTVAEVAPINLANSNRLDLLLRAGRVYLSLQDAIALALENNLDIEISRYGPRIAEADLLRSEAGGVVRGVPTSVVQGPSSAANLQTGGGGGGQGGGNATGSAGGANNATVLFTGTNVPDYDESFFLTYNWGHRTLTQANSFNTGIPALVFRNKALTGGIQKGFKSGALVQLGYNQSTQQSNNRVSEINPFTNGSMNLQVTQPLLRGFGFAVNNRFIRVARNQVKISDMVFRQQIIATVANVVNLYSDLVSFTENVKVKKSALSLAQKLFNDNRTQVQIGTLAPIEIVKAEAEVARAEQELTVAETQVLQQETILKNYLSRTGVNSPVISDARIVPTDTLQMPEREAIQPIQDLVAVAVENRPELAQTRLAIENSRISLDGDRSQLLPSFDLVAAAQNNALAGQANTLPLPTNVSEGFVRQPNGAFLGGLGSVWSQILGRNYPDYSVGFQLSIPLRNRAARADMIRDQLTLRQNELRQRQELNQIRVDVQNAMIGLQQSRAQYQAASKSRVLQDRTLDAEQKKYALGASTVFFVIQAQRDLAQAQGAEVAALSSYNRARVSMDRATGRILEVHNVSLDEAVTGRVQRQADAIPAVTQP